MFSIIAGVIKRAAVLCEADFEGRFAFVILKTLYENVIDCIVCGSVFKITGESIILYQKIFSFFARGKVNIAAVHADWLFNIFILSEFDAVLNEIINIFSFINVVARGQVIITVVIELRSVSTGVIIFN